MGEGYELLSHYLQRKIRQVLRTMVAENHSPNERLPLQTGKIAEPATTFEKIKVCLEHVKKICEFCGENAGIKRSRKLLGWYYRHLTGKSKIDQRLFQVDTYTEVEHYLNEFLESAKEDAA